MAGLYRKRRQSRPKTDAQGRNSLTERDFLQQVRYLAKQFQWLVYHTHNSQRSEPGFPDLVLLKPPEIIFAELKTTTGKLTEPQKQWLEALNACNIETYVWRPHDMAFIIERLRPKTPQKPPLFDI